jgi:hypothetical protein
MIRLIGMRCAGCLKRWCGTPEGLAGRGRRACPFCGCAVTDREKT